MMFVEFVCVCVWIHVYNTVHVQVSNYMITY